MGKISLRIEEDLHDLIDQVQTERMKRKGERPSKEEVVADGLSKLVEEEVGEKDNNVSEFDKVFGL